jgi:glycosyltransferase involved in cell wall biosynthesis
LFGGGLESFLREGLGKLRILIVQESDWLRRNNHQQHHLAELMSLRGHEVRVIDYEVMWKKDDGGLWAGGKVYLDVNKIYENAKVTVIRPETLKIKVLDYLSLLWTHYREIKRQILEFKPDVVVGFSILNSYIALGLCKQYKIPFVYYWLDVLHLLVPIKQFQPLAKSIESRIMKQADLCLAINDTLGEYMSNLGAKKVEIIKAGVNFNMFKLTGKNIRKEYGIKDEDIVLLFVGWLYNFSGLKEIALKLAERRNSFLKLIIVGDGDAYEELKQIQKSNHTEDKLILVGRKPYEEIPAFIESSDICILPSYINEPIMQDNVPIKMYEYLAMGKPVITTKLNGIMREFGYDNGVVYVDKPEDVINRSVDMAEFGFVKMHGEQARNFVKDYTWDKRADEFENTLKGLIN